MVFEKNSRVIMLLKDSELLIGDNGYVTLDSNWKATAVCSPYTRLYFVESGEGEIYDNSGTHSLSPGNVYVIPAGYKFGYGCKEKLVKLYAHVNVFRLDGFDMLFGADKICCFNLGVTRVKEICQMYKNANSVNAFLLKGAFFEAVCAALKENNIDAENENNYSELVLKCIEYIRGNLSVNLTVKSISKSLFVSESKLTKAFAAETGCGVGRYIDELILHEAQRKLISSDESIKHISDELGFCDRFYFSRHFKRICGISPAKYRKLVRKG